ncbi:hypothetical protein N7453_005473 [Penicillium expansum]|nr:hypothetical protein N7453_005473 [Penicillium expansum]
MCDRDLPSRNSTIQLIRPSNIQGFHPKGGLDAVNKATCPDDIDEAEWQGMASKPYQRITECTIKNKDSSQAIRITTQNNPQDPDPRGSALGGTRRERAEIGRYLLRSVLGEHDPSVQNQ